MIAVDKQGVLCEKRMTILGNTTTHCFTQAWQIFSFGMGLDILYQNLAHI